MLTTYPFLYHLPAREPTAGDEIRAAACRALHLPELVSAVLAHLKPVDVFDDDLDGDDWLAATVAAAAANRAALFAALLVNHTWFAAAVPILWACPSEDAPGFDAVTAPARRAFYAAHVRHVRVYRRSTLWRALADAEAISRSDGVAGGSVEMGGVHEVGGVLGRLGSGGGLHLPRLAELHENIWPTPNHSVSAPLTGEQVRIDLAPLLCYINAKLESLRCNVTEEVLNRLFALRVPFVPQNPNEDLTSPGELGTQEVSTCVRELPQEQQRLNPAVRLRTLYLDASIHATDSDSRAMEERLLAWFTQAPCMAPTLTSVALYHVFGPTKPSIVDGLFRHFAFREGLERLRIYHDPDFTPAHGAASLSALEDIVQVSMRSCRGVVGDNAWNRSATPPHTREQLVLPTFPHLRELELMLDSTAAISPLAQLLPPGLTFLALLIVNDNHPDDMADGDHHDNTDDVAVNDDEYYEDDEASVVDVAFEDNNGDAEESDDEDYDDGDAAAAPPMLAPLAKFSQLRTLRIYMKGTAPLSRADLRALHALAQLHELRLYGEGAKCGSATDAEVAALLRALCRLRKLELEAFMPRLTPLAALLIVGESLPLLRHVVLTGGGSWQLAPAMDAVATTIAIVAAGASTTPLFPGLDYLRIMYPYASEDNLSTR
jgi:hypothetical protein